ncbi:MAG: hypothetical protein KGQ38_07535 [Actinomycetales bacterium]|nr:hypothetical protein [Actinomycetales bacterium]
MTVPPIDPIQPNEGQSPKQNFQYQPMPADSGFTQAQVNNYAGPTINVLAVIGFALAVTGTGCGIISLILSIMGYSQISKEPQRYSGKGFAVAGIVISVLFIILLPILAFLGLLGAIFSEADTNISGMASAYSLFLG